MNKYIIKNCPAYYYDKEFNYHICKQPLVPYEGRVDYCLNCPDCIIKQILELCKSTCRKRCTNDCLGTRKHCGYGQILNLLEIEEVDE